MKQMKVMVDCTRGIGGGQKCIQNFVGKPLAKWTLG
jgi:hypothetical protein